MSIDRAIANAAASVEMEGFSVDEESKRMCRKLLKKEITMEQYIEFTLAKARVRKVGTLANGGENQEITGGEAGGCGQCE